MKLKIGHCQLACTAGDTAANVDRVLAGLKEAASEHIDILSFPECFLTGYFRSAEQAGQHSLRVDGPEIADLLRRTARFETTFIVGFNELRRSAGPDALRSGDLYNTALVAERGALLGTYSKAFPICDYFTPGRDFPVFEKKGVCYGVILCADGAYIEPSRILAFKGARIIFAPHYNNLPAGALINHVHKVRADHIARASENGVWFLRGNNVQSETDRRVFPDAVGYGESYLLDPFGEIVARSQRHEEGTIAATIDVREYTWEEKPFFASGRRESLASARALRDIYLEALEGLRE
jgi:predicted amidohydrolase